MTFWPLPKHDIAMFELNNIHPTALIEEGAEIGQGNYIGPFVYIRNGVRIGDRNRIESHVVIGSPAEHRDYFNKYGLVKIGNNNIIREFVTINAPTRARSITKLGNNCAMLRHSHLSHDSIVEDWCNISCDVLIGGESIIMQGANIGLGAILHQKSVIGSWSMIGMNSTVTKKGNIGVGEIHAGTPASMIGVNKIGLDRHSVEPRDVDREMQRFIKMKKDGVYVQAGS